MVRLDLASPEPLHQQLYRQIRDQLKSGTFSDRAARLPSSRALAVDLGISRLTVDLAFSKLHAEGYLRSKARSGTFVAHPLPETFLSAAKSKPYPTIDRPPRISERVQAIPDRRIGREFDLGAPNAAEGASIRPTV